MNQRSSASHPVSNANLWSRLAAWLLLAAAFAIAYAQSPLYTSNQNQYFLHGLARAGLGYLSQDWLANTLDPTPVFSFLVEWTYRLTHLEALFYLYYAVLMGVYLFCLVGIVGEVFPIRQSPAVFLLYLAALILVHSAGWRLVLSRALGDNWTYLLEDGLADQRLLGPVFQPSTFGVLLLLSLYLFLKRRPYWAVLSAALAATLHPTYLLSAAALTLAYMLVIFGETRRLDRPLWIGLAALLAVLPIVIYAYVLFGSTPPETTAQARQVLVNYRIPHHALIDWWLDLTAAIKIGLVLAALLVVRRSRLLLVIAVPFLTAAALTILQVFLESNALALLFPWRLSTWLLPLSTALLVAWLVTLLAQRFASQMKRCQFWVRAASLALIALCVLVGAVRFKLDLDRQAAYPDRPMMTYVADHIASEEVYLIPIKMQDFRLVTGAPAFVEFKSIPYRDVDVLEWYRRVQLADRFYKGADCAKVTEIALQENITHIILPAKSPTAACPQLRPVYQDEAYGVYRIIINR